MKTRFSRLIAVVAFLLPCAGKLAAEESYRLESRVFVFKHGDFQSIKLPAATETGGNGAVVIRSPATIEFDQEKLSFSGTDFSWSGGRNPPEKFTLIKIPEIITGPGKPVEMLSSVSIQYLEKKADGALQVRTIDKDSSDAPHCRIRFAVGSPDAASKDLRVSCDLDISTVTARVPVSGVNLNIGRPLLAHFQDRVELAVSPGEWAALLLRAPNGSDYSLLLLLKTMPPQAPDTVVTQAGRHMTIKELDQFATYYYLHPQPELIARAIESLGPSGFLDTVGRTYPHHFRQRAYTCVGFFAEVFAANPERVAQWRNIIDRMDGESRFWLRKALKWSRPGAILGFESDDLKGLDEIHVFWGAFFASGNPVYLQKLTNQVGLVDDTIWERFDVGALNMVLLSSNAPRHPLVRQTLESSRKEVNPRTRELIDDLLNRDLAEVLQKVRDMDHSSSYANIGDSRNDLPWRRPLQPSATKSSQP